MTIAKTETMCDICGALILVGEILNPFSLKGIERTLHCHDDCKPKVLEAMGKDDWKLLPDGPLKREFEKHEQGES